MFQKSKQTGIRISQINEAKLFDNKLDLNYNFITYAPYNFGITTINKNFRIPIDLMRQDFCYFVGLKNVKNTNEDWNDLTYIWNGSHTEYNSSNFEEKSPLYFIENCPIENFSKNNDNDIIFVEKNYIDNKINHEVDKLNETIDNLDYIKNIKESDFIFSQNDPDNKGTVELILKTDSTITKDSEYVPTTKAVHDTVYKKEVYFKNEIIRQEITEIGEYEYQSDISGTVDAADGCYGICYIPQKNVKVRTIQINQINKGGSSATNINNCYIKIFAKNEEGIWKLVANSSRHQVETNGPTQITAGSSTQNYWSNTWEVQGAGINQGNDFIAKAGVEYHVTLNNNNDVDSYETGYSLRMCMYRNNSNEYVLGSDVNHSYTNYTPNFNVYGTELNIENVIERKELTETEVPTEFYGEYTRNKHDISHKYDKTNNVVSFNDGIIKFSDGTERYFDVQKAIIAKYLFRVANGSESSSITSFNERNNFHQWNNETYRNDFYYEYDAYDGDIDDDIDSNGKEKLSTLQNVINGKNLFLRSQLTKFNDDLSCLMNAHQMFGFSKKLTTFKSALPSLTNGIRMFYGCSALTKFETKLPNLVLAECMFRNNTSLVEVNTCLPNLTHAQGMFGGCSNLSKIRFSKNSFQCLYNGCDMFNGCSKIGSFYYELPYLETADDMFLDCQLDVKSVRIIANSLYDFGTKDSNDYAEDGRKHVITIGIRQGDRDKVQTYVELMDSKGWVVEINEYSGNEPLPPSKDEPETEPDPDNPDTPVEPDPEPEPDPTPDPEQSIYDISETNPNEENPYVANIPAWRTEVYEQYNLKINSITSDENRNFGIMIGTVGENN